MDKCRRPAFCFRRKDTCKISNAESVEAVGNRGKRQRAALGKLGGQLVKINHDVRSIPAELQSAGPAIRKQDLGVEDRSITMEGKDFPENRSIISGWRHCLASK